MNRSGLMEKALSVLRERGSPALELAKTNILEEAVKYEPLLQALQYFIKRWNDFLHPGLAALSCEAVGGKPEITKKIGAALVLMAGGADIHDDLIDESVVKGEEQTVLGKFGRNLAILAGDVLLFKGTCLLHEASDNLEATTKRAVLNIVKQTLFEVSWAEAAESCMRGRIDVPKEEYVETIRHKVAAGEASARIGAILGGGSEEEVNILSEFGRVYGILLSMRDEYVDMFEPDELGNRLKNEVVPLPIMVALSNELLKPKLLDLLKGELTDRKTEEIVEIVYNSFESQLLSLNMKQMIEQTKEGLQKISYCKENLLLLLNAALEDL